MTELILYPIHKNILSTIKPLYEISSGFICHDDMLCLESDQIDNLIQMRQNLLLDFQISLRSFNNNSHYVLNLLDVKSYLIDQKAEHYLIGDYLFYCLVFNKDTNLQEQLKKQILSLSNEQLVTLSTYISLNGNTMRSAKNLYMHRNSLMYRIVKIEETLGLDLSEIKVIQSLAIILLQMNI